MTETAQRRKSGRIAAYDYAQNGAYFVTICTQNRTKILIHIVGDGSPVPKSAGIVAEETLHRIQSKYPAVTVDKYVIMPDHIHILLRIETVNGAGDPPPTLSNVVAWYKYQVTKQVNMQASLPSKKLFQRNYYDHVIRNQRDYDEIYEYIETNPKRWIMREQNIF